MPPTMTDQEFDAVAATCRRMSARSLAAARAILVDGEPVAEVARAHGMKPPQATMIRNRVIERAERMRLEAFTRREKPARADLSDYAREIASLHGQGYAADQIVAFLAEHGAATDVEAVEACIVKMEEGA